MGLHLSAFDDRALPGIATVPVCWYSWIKQSRGAQRTLQQGLFVELRPMVQKNTPGPGPGMGQEYALCMGNSSL